ncbi:hypothetical protein BBP00_00007508 [Phytophthora kernoviae]|uniref:SAM-dependent MTase RsmB/NOP-type domain-containing protein n=1 Tax=Phytophthora kernoviae TaxID=325452 RepID=A0A3F2RI17_9STRA|nr:hypothetical protein BBP00_00007508 [Phytophthora kernoviae]
MDAKKRGLLSGVYVSVGVLFTACAKVDWLSKGASAAFLSLLWLGFVLAISCTESWVKFRAPFLPRHLALDLGRTMFAALNSVEIGLCVGLWLLHYVVASSSSGDAFWRLIIATFLLVVQVGWLYPKLELTAEFALYEELKELDDEKLSFNQKMQFGEMRHKVQIQDKPHRMYHFISNLLALKWQHPIRRVSSHCSMVSGSEVREALTADGAAAAKQPLIMQYYLRQGIIRPEEVERVRATLEAPLPACFRVNPMSPLAPHIIDRLTDEFPKAFASVSELEGQPLAPPRELTWYSVKHGRAWQLDCGKAALARGARDNSPIQDFRVFLMHHTAEGNLSRQEAVSMVPVLLLDVRPHHHVLDMCAAPGSKSAQIMEALLPENSGHDTNGFVVANDANEKRGYLLVHQLQRLGLDNFVVTCHEGQNFPGLYDPEGGFDVQSTNVFDRVLCDVPCSGDGTIRKNRNLWGRWAPGSALTLHETQLDLALRAAALLRDNGDSFMTYSTCSLNPIENEAVIAELLRRVDGALELVDCSAMLPGLITRPGVTSWDVAWQARTSKGEARAPLQCEVNTEKITKEVKQTYMKLRTEHWDQIKEFYGIQDGFPQENLYSRSEGTASVSLVNPSIRASILAGEHVNILDTGLRVFARVQAAGKLVFRPTEEGLERLLPFVTKRKAPATSEDLFAIVNAPGNNSKQVALGLNRFSELLQDAAAAVREHSGY